MRFLIYPLMLASLIACQPKAESGSGSETSDYADAVEAAVNVVSGGADDAAGEAIVARSFSFFPEALAACSRTLTNLGGGHCTRNVNCDYGAYLWSGTVSLQFANNSTCSLTGSGDSFTRTVDFSRTGPRGTLQTTSNTHSTWDGVSLGGGIQVSQVDATGNLEMDILGQRKILTRTGGRTLFNVSVETSAPLQMNKLARNGRVISSGTILVHHNIAQFNVEHQLQNLSFSSSCCYPTSGSIQSTFSGSRTGSASVSFNGCGSMTTVVNGESRTYSLANCE